MAPPGERLPYVPPHRRSFRSTYFPPTTDTSSSPTTPATDRSENEPEDAIRKLQEQVQRLETTTAALQKKLSAEARPAQPDDQCVQVRRLEATMAGLHQQLATAMSAMDIEDADMVQPPQADAATVGPSRTHATTVDTSTADTTKVDTTTVETSQEDAASTEPDSDALTSRYLQDRSKVTIATATTKMWRVAPVDILPVKFQASTPYSLALMVSLGAYARRTKGDYDRAIVYLATAEQARVEASIAPPSQLCVTAVTAFLIRDDARVHVEAEIIEKHDGIRLIDVKEAHGRLTGYQRRKRIRELGVTTWAGVWRMRNHGRDDGQDGSHEPDDCRQAAAHLKASRHDEQGSTAAQIAPARGQDLIDL
ncbi:hypothetical protein LTR53_012790 [Teratosphaeriaceae sp. CCFEE 6253]|nr:hypothetical protein LTR53_012790 [Teratosphaeriaceae sp. CCFEE 6253]